MRTIRCVFWYGPTALGAKQLTSKEITEFLHNYEKAAKEKFDKSQKDGYDFKHIVYACKYYKEDDTLDSIYFYSDPILYTEELFEENVVPLKNKRVYALHA